MIVFNVNTNAPEANTIRLTALDFEDYRARAQIASKRWPDTSGPDSRSAATGAPNWSSGRW